MAFDRILVTLDGSPLGEESLSHALGLARVYGSSLYLLRVLDVAGTFEGHAPDDVVWRLLKAEAGEYLRAIAEGLIEENIEIECHVTEGRAPEQIVEFVREHHIDLVILTAWGWGGASEFPFGGTVQKLVAEPETSMMVIRSTEPGKKTTPGYGRILVPLDGSQRAVWALSLLWGMASRADSPELVLLHVVEFPDMPRTRPLTQEEAELRTKFVECNRRAATTYLEETKRRFSNGLSIRTRLEISSHVAETIYQVAEEEQVDLIALTAHGASGAGSKTSGATCQCVLRAASRPVLVLQDTTGKRHEQTGPLAFDQLDRKLYTH